MGTFTRNRYTPRQGQYLAFIYCYTIPRSMGTPCGNRYAKVFQGLSTFCTPDGTHTGEEGIDQENTGSGMINIPVYAV
jgi:hypothetical protein